MNLNLRSKENVFYSDYNDTYVFLVIINYIKVEKA